MPGFINLNHPGGQRSRLLELHPDRRYTLDELDRQLPPLTQEDAEDSPTRVRGRYTSGSFDPHWPGPLPLMLQHRLVDLCKGLDLQRYSDGRFSGACPLPHRAGGVCDCQQAFYASPVSGAWSCFCSDHLGPTSGTLSAFASLGLVTDLTLVEMQAEVGKHHLGRGKVRHYRPSPAEDRGPSSRSAVADRVITKSSIYRKSDKGRTRGKRPTLWEEARSLFPIPSYVQPRMKGYLLWSERDGQGLAVDLFSNTWRNPANAQYKRQKLYFNILPRINRHQIYQRRVAIDDWDKQVHRHIARAIQRATEEGQGWLWFDNALERGYILYLSDVPGLAGFEPVEEARAVLIDALKSIHPPGRDQEEGRFRPYGGSQNWVGNAEDAGEEDAGRWETVAVAQGPTDFLNLEAECVASGVATEYQPVYWRGQPYHALAMRHPSKEALVDFARSFSGQYALTRAVLTNQSTNLSR